MDFIYVEDIAEILCRALLDEHGIYDRIFEAGSGRKTTINEIADLVVFLAGSKSKIIHEPMRAGENGDSIVLADVATLAPLNIRQDNLVSLNIGLVRTIDYYRKNLESYK